MRYWTDGLPQWVQFVVLAAVTGRGLSGYWHAFLLDDAELRVRPILDCPAGASRSPLRPASAAQP